MLWWFLPIYFLFLLLLPFLLEGSEEEVSYWALELAPVLALHLSTVPCSPVALGLCCPVNIPLLLWTEVGTSLLLPTFANTSILWYCFVLLDGFQKLSFVQQGSFGSSWTPLILILPGKILQPQQIFHLPISHPRPTRSEDQAVNIYSGESDGVDVRLPNERLWLVLEVTQHH